MRFLLFICTTVILAMSSAEFLDDPSVSSANVRAKFPRRYVIGGLMPSHGMDGSLYDLVARPDKEPPKKLPKEVPRNTRSVEAYGMPKKWLDNNGMIEKIVPMAAKKVDKLENETPRRVTRSIPKEPENEANDLEAQDAKVFRPLFVYRQQVAKRQKLNRRRDHGYYPSHSQIYKPWVQRYPTH